ncbi:hypothetical protein BCV69DRAFT_312413 [Microstroma glucosiphilum]|uniref:Uncharacterized protein n=1 Tax=Pseudomicrostroma glucosiphilum TaxID=1684307 RepID=A0A316U7E9_9BASI|nr:hypothetical protein BCV69DRAFT_312413 [Pseudomicrostroma glucosiphilum]PWN21159.1 hypothetical protein BCV69DRAFT_312413 [Pseudomicrostroma glucosiphilum]
MSEPIVDLDSSMAGSPAFSTGSREAHQKEGSAPKSGRPTPDPQSPSPIGNLMEDLEALALGQNPPLGDSGASDLGVLERGVSSLDLRARADTTKANATPPNPPLGDSGASYLGVLERGVSSLDLRERADTTKANSTQRHAEVADQGEARGSEVGGEREEERRVERERVVEGMGGARERQGSRGQRGGPKEGPRKRKGVGNKEIGTAAYHANRKRKARKIKKEKTPYIRRKWERTRAEGAPIIARAAAAAAQVAAQVAVVAASTAEIQAGEARSAAISGEPARADAAARAARVAYGMVLGARATVAVLASTARAEADEAQAAGEAGDATADTKADVQDVLQSAEDADDEEAIALGQVAAAAASAASATTAASTAAAAAEAQAAVELQRGKARQHAEERGDERLKEKAMDTWRPKQGAQEEVEGKKREGVDEERVDEGRVDEGRVDEGRVDEERVEEERVNEERVDEGGAISVAKTDSPPVI